MVVLTQILDTLIIGVEGELIITTAKTMTNRIVQIPQAVLPPNLKKGQEEVIKNGSKNLTCISCSDNGDFIAVSAENKQVVLFDKDFNVVRNFVVSRAVSKMCFTPDNNLLLADKTGDVMLYKVKEETSEVLLGHLSMLLDVKLSECGKYIITSDRDEKIRVSHFPNAYNIQSFCLGHKEFVTHVEVCGELLISASGDGTIRFWDFLNGVQLNVIDTNEHVKDKSVIERFCNEMDQDNIEVLALPIRDLQVFKNGSKLIIGAVLVCVEGIMLYEVENQYPDIQTKFLRTVTVDGDILSVSLGRDLYVLTTKGLEHFRFKENDFIKQQSLKEVYKMCKLDCLKAGDLSVLYKRKFDNVQEYLERKRLRLEGRE